jgi:hypothetical protein
MSDDQFRIVVIGGAVFPLGIATTNRVPSAVTSYGNPGVPRTRAVQVRSTMRGPTARPSAEPMPGVPWDTNIEVPADRGNEQLKLLDLHRARDPGA